MTATTTTTGHRCAGTRDWTMGTKLASATGITTWTAFIIAWTSGNTLHSRDLAPSSSSPGKVFIPTNPFTDSAALQALKESFVKQPNWKAGLVLMSENHHSWTILNFVHFTISIVILINFLSSFPPSVLDSRTEICCL